MHLSIAAVGSRGDVQPYLALGLGLQKAGYQVQICADSLFENLVTSKGLSYAPVTGAPVDMMQQNLSRVGGPITLIGWLEKNFKPLARQFFSDLEAATRHTDAILCRPAILGRAGVSPWSRTSPHPVQEAKCGKSDPGDRSLGK